MARNKSNRQPKRLERPRTVRIKPHTYQPTKAEMEAVIPPPRNPDGSRATPEQVALAILRPAKIVKDSEA